MITELYPPKSIEESKLTYVVMAARYRKEWIFVRHRDRKSWEMPAGHIEQGESADQAAVRELFEEAGVVRSSIVHICDYSVLVREKKGYGRLYGASVEELDPHLEHEIDELLFTADLPVALTYPEVQTILFKRAEKHFQT
ncbi:MAG: NUDIX domain-containing protein [Bacteroidales bacterium]|nr:NUDIX domain-containing protein [Bacteroidales bacterium]